MKILEKVARKQSETLMKLIIALLYYIKQIEHLKIYLSICFLIVLFMRAQPVWTMGFFQDDTVINSWGYEAQQTGRSILKYCYDLMIGMFVSQGRVSPVLFLNIPLQMAVADNLLLFRLIQSIAQIVALTSFFLFIKKLSNNFYAAIVVCFLFITVYEIRYYHDSAFSYFLFMPIIIIIGCAACYCSICNKNSNKSILDWKLVSVLVLNCILILTYETAMVFCFIASVLMLLTEKDALKTRIIRAGIAISPAFIFVIYTLVLKQKSTYSGTKIGVLDLQTIIITYAKQISAAIPLSYYYFDPSRIFQQSIFQLDNILPFVAIMLVSFVGLFIGIRQIKLINLFPIILTGVILLTTPSLMISLSAKYQDESKFGLGYLQTVLSYLGLSLIIIGGVTSTREFINIRSRYAADVFVIIFLSAISTIAGLSYLSSYRVASSVNEYWRYPRELLELWMKITPKSPSNQSELIVLHKQDLSRWENSNFIYQYRGIRGKFVANQSFSNSTSKNLKDTVIINLKYPSSFSADDVSMIIDQDQTNGGNKIRGYAVSKNLAKLRLANIGVKDGEKSYFFDSIIEIGVHGYYIRRISFESSGSDFNNLGLINYIN